MTQISGTNRLSGELTLFSSGAPKSTKGFSPSSIMYGAPPSLTRLYAFPRFPTLGKTPMARSKHNTISITGNTIIGTALIYSVRPRP